MLLALLLVALATGVYQPVGEPASSPQMRDGSRPQGFENLRQDGSVPREKVPAGK